jgi:hypothetical protein
MHIDCKSKTKSNPWTNNTYKITQRKEQNRTESVTKTWPPQQEQFYVSNLLECLQCFLIMKKFDICQNMRTPSAPLKSYWTHHTAQELAFNRQQSSWVISVFRIQWPDRSYFPCRENQRWERKQSIMHRFPLFNKSKTNILLSLLSLAHGRWSVCRRVISTLHGHRN